MIEHIMFDFEMVNSQKPIRVIERNIESFEVLTIEQIMEGNMSKNNFDFDNMFQALFLNELSGNKKLATRLSWAGNNNSGISFGYHQIDTRHNPQGFELLKKYGITDSQIEKMKTFNRMNKTSKSFKTWRNKNKADVKQIEEILQKKDEELKQISIKHIEHTFDHIMNVIQLDVTLEGFTVLAHLIDYHNQFHFSLNGKIHTWIKSLPKGTVITKQMVYNFKKTTKWAQSSIGLKDIKRRTYNINKFSYFVADERMVTFGNLKIFKRG